MALLVATASSCRSGVVQAGTLARRHFTITSAVGDRHPRAQPPAPYTPPPPFPSLDAPQHILQSYREPKIAIPPGEDPLLSFMTNLIMREGKKNTARKHISLCLSHLRQVTQLEPIPLLEKAITLASPLVRLQTEKKSIKSIQVPMALSERQRMRKSIMSIVKASKRRTPKQLGARIAMEVIAVLNGNSETLRQKTDVHKLATVNRSNLRRIQSAPRI